jgi:hypothetical protein
MRTAEAYLEGCLSVTQIEARKQEKRAYQAPQLKEYGDLGVLTLGGSGMNMDNPLGMGLFSTKT